MYWFDTASVILSRGRSNSLGELVCVAVDYTQWGWRWAGPIMSVIATHYVNPLFVDNVRPIGLRVPLQVLSCSLR